jgi:hypothetical protein
MEQITSWEANSFSASHEIPRVLWDPKVSYRIPKNAPPISNLGKQVCKILFILRFKVSAYAMFRLHDCDT